MTRVLARVTGRATAWLYDLDDATRTAWFVDTEPVEATGLYPPTQHALRRAGGWLLVYQTYGPRCWYHIVKDAKDAPVTWDASCDDAKATVVDKFNAVRR